MTGHLVDATGTRRRLQALAALGHDATTIVAALGDPATSRTRVFQWRNPARRVIDARTAIAVAGVYRRLGHTRGTNSVARIRALKAGFLPASAWDGVDIDDPEARPHRSVGAPAPDDEEAA